LRTTVAPGVPFGDSAVSERLPLAASVRMTFFGSVKRRSLLPVRSVREPSASPARFACRLPVPLETTHLILVQHTPRSISFRFDEKRFDVDGAYDIRYEIFKKSIDKAVVEGTSDRVTQPGKIAIIFGQTAEGREYRGYIEYLQSLGYLTSEVEELSLGELQGVQGLRALRVAVALENPAILQHVGLDPNQR